MSSSPGTTFGGGDTRRRTCLVSLTREHEFVAFGIDAHGQVRRLPGGVRHRVSEELTTRCDDLARSGNDIRHLKA